MAYSHCQTQIRTQTRTLIPNPMGSLYYVEIFTMVGIQIRIPVQRVSQIITVPILGTDVHPYSIHFNQGIRVRIRTNVKFLHSTGIQVRVGIRVRIRQCEQAIRPRAKQTWLQTGS